MRPALYFGSMTSLALSIGATVNALTQPFSTPSNGSLLVLAAWMAASLYGLVLGSLPRKR